MQNIQFENESLAQKNFTLGQDFGNEVKKKNESSQQIGQIISSINNVYNIC